MDVKLARNRDGTMIHRIDCPIRGVTSRPWLWADDQSPEAVCAVMMRNNYRACRRCKPLTDDFEHWRMLNGEV